jgi:hypothetical protein
MGDITCVTCERQSNKDDANGWLIRPKVTGKPGELFVICDRCLNLGSATLDVADSKPFRTLEREVRRERDGDNQRIWNAGGV